MEFESANKKMMREKKKKKVSYEDDAVKKGFGPLPREVKYSEKFSDEEKSFMNCFFLALRADNKKIILTTPSFIPSKKKNKWYLVFKGVETSEIVQWVPLDIPYKVQTVPSNKEKEYDFEEYDDIEPSQHYDESIFE